MINLQKLKIHQILLVIFILTFANLQVQSQSQSLDNIRLLITPVNPVIIPLAALDSISSPLDLLTNSDSVYLKVTFEIDSIANVSEFNVELGSDSISFLLFNDTYYFDNFNPGGEKTYKRIGKYIELGLGKYPYTPFYLKARYKNIVQVASSYTYHQFIH